MKVWNPLDAVIFLEQARDFLLEREAENGLMLGIADLLARRPPLSDEKRYFWSVLDEGRVVGASLWTPPFKPVITRMEPSALDALLTSVLGADVPLNGVSGPEWTANAFAQSWVTRTGGTLRPIMRMLVKSLQKVNDLPEVPGSLRMAGEADLPWVHDWVERFHEIIGLNEPIENRKIADEYVKEKRLFYWERDGQPVSMAGFTGRTPTGVRVNLVFTPPEGRNRGYARACVSSLSRYLLSKGARFCFLFSDRGNPVSNRVYERVGFQAVSDWVMYEFKTPPQRLGG